MLLVTQLHTIGGLMWVVFKFGQK